MSVDRRTDIRSMMDQINRRLDERRPDFNLAAAGRRIDTRLPDGTNQPPSTPPGNTGSDANPPQRELFGRRKLIEERRNRS